jgi:hypothetical protein
MSILLALIREDTCQFRAAPEFDFLLCCQWLGLNRKAGFCASGNFFRAEMAARSMHF